MELPAFDSVLSVQMQRYLFSNLRYSSTMISLRNFALADKFLTIEHKVIIISYMHPRSGAKEGASGFGRDKPTISCLLNAEGSFFDKEDSFPRDDGRTAGNSSTFFKEFLRMRVGLRSVRVDSDSRCDTNASKAANMGLMIAVSRTIESFFSSCVSLLISSNTLRSSPKMSDPFSSVSSFPLRRNSCWYFTTKVMDSRYAASC
jgi:hypothetical protein